jgi:hypothetical protein
LTIFEKDKNLFIDLFSIFSDKDSAFTINHIDQSDEKNSVHIISA